MRRLVILVLVAATAWYGYKHWSDLRRQPGDVAVIDNQSGKELDRFRLIVGDEKIVREVIPAGSSVTIPFAVRNDGPLGMQWQFERSDLDQNWAGGQLTAGPMRTRHHLTIEADGGVIYTSERMAADAKP